MPSQRISAWNGRNLTVLPKTADENSHSFSFHTVRWLAPDRIQGCLLGSIGSVHMWLHSSMTLYSLFSWTGSRCVFSGSTVSHTGEGHAVWGWSFRDTKPRYCQDLKGKSSSRGLGQFQMTRWTLLTVRRAIWNKMRKHGMNYKGAYKSWMRQEADWYNLEESPRREWKSKQNLWRKRWRNVDKWYVVMSSRVNQSHSAVSRSASVKNRANNQKQNAPVLHS